AAYIFFLPIKAASVSSETPKISEIEGPMIDAGAASVMAEDGSAGSSEKVLPAKIWIYLLFAYCFLKVFNLSFRFQESAGIRWAWEAAYTFLALFAWSAWDKSADFVWFPLYVLKLGILIYLAYLYFFARKKSADLAV
ncbi:MAG TPA: hypothetical protein DIT25_04680, partial [Candidatus Moranbacteria bacterium]|nr:hypothetical protein [Candidatus Moranbacteria bacterium]